MSPSSTVRSFTFRWADDVEGDGDDGEDWVGPPHSGRHWPDPGDPAEDATPALRNRYAVVGYLVDRFRDYAATYYSSNPDYQAGYQAGMRKSAIALVNWLKGKDLWDR